MGGKNEVFFTNATQTTPRSDFTMVDQPTGNVWRTLSGGSSGEWYYLLETRSVNGGTGEGKSYQRATINSDYTGVYGMIIYPDDYTSQTSATSYTSSDWTTMENAGCVFLPAAGYRNGSSLELTGLAGSYWSSTTNSGLFAYSLSFFMDIVNPAYDEAERARGLSVRLVSAAQ